MTNATADPDPADPAPPAPGRRERRRAATMKRLLDAAETVMGRDGLDAPIAEITEAADTGFGTFYSYFASKDDLVRTVIDEQLADLSRRNQTLAANVDDPAEILARKLALVLLLGMEQPSWAAFHVAALAEPATEMAEQITRRFAADIDHGITSTRFHSQLHDSGVMFVVAGHTAALQRIAQPSLPNPDPADVVAQCLVVLGIERTDATATAQRSVDAARQAVQTEPANASTAP